MFIVQANVVFKGVIIRVLEVDTILSVRITSIVLDPVEPGLNSVASDLHIVDIPTGKTF